MTGLVLALIAFVILVLLWLIKQLNHAVDVLFIVKQGDVAMIVTEFDLGNDGRAVIKLVPINLLGGDASIEEVNFTADDPEVTLVVSVDDPLTFIATTGPDITNGKDVILSLSCDGHLGEGVNQINKQLVCHLRRRDAVDVGFNVTVEK